MSVVLSLTPDEEVLFEEWAAQQGEEVQRDAHRVLASMNESGDRESMARHFFRAVEVTQPILHEAADRCDLRVGEYLLVLLKAMTAFYHVRGGQTPKLAEISGSSPLDDAVTLYDFGVVSAQAAARIARLSVREFDFTVSNLRRIELIRKRSRGKLTSSEAAELQRLQGEIRRRVDAKYPLPPLVSAEPGLSLAPGIDSAD